MEGGKGKERNDDNNSSLGSKSSRRTGLGEPGKDGVGGGGLTTAGRGVHEPRGEREGGDSLCLSGWWWVGGWSGVVSDDDCDDDEQIELWSSKQYTG